MMDADFVELILLLFVFIGTTIFEHSKAGKKLKERRKRLEEERREEERRSEAEWQKGLEERVRAGEKTKELLFEIPTMRPSAPDAETKLPQAERIFVRRQEPIEEECEDDTGIRYPDVLVDYAPTAIETKELPKMTAPTKTKPVDSKYQAWLKRNPTARESDEVMTSILHTLEEIRDRESNVRIPTSRERLIEGIILAEVLGKPKAYQNRRRV